MSHPADEVAVRCSYRPLARSHDTHVSAQARSARWRRDSTTRLYEYFQQAFFHTVQIDLLGCRYDDAADSVSDLLSFEYRRSNTHVGYAAVRARTYDHLIDVSACCFFYSLCI